MGFKGAVRGASSSATIAVGARWADRMTFALLKRALDSHSLEEPLLTVQIPGAQPTCNRAEVAGPGIRVASKIDFRAGLLMWDTGFSGPPRARRAPSTAAGGSPAATSAHTTATLAASVQAATQPRTMAQRFVGQPGGKTAFDKRHSDDSLAPAAQLQRRETSKRLVSWEEGNNQLALLDSDYKAAHCPARYAGRATVREPTIQLARVLQGLRLRDSAAGPRSCRGLAARGLVCQRLARRVIARCGQPPAHIGWGQLALRGSSAISLGRLRLRGQLRVLHESRRSRARRPRGVVGPRPASSHPLTASSRRSTRILRQRIWRRCDTSSPSWNWDRTDRWLLPVAACHQKTTPAATNTGTDAMATADIDLSAIDVAIDADGAAAVLIQ